MNDPRRHRAGVSRPRRVGIAGGLVLAAAVAHGTAIQAEPRRAETPEEVYQREAK